MQLDHTHVVIRVRTLTEISDLAMVMIRSYPAASSWGFALGALPWAIANAVLLGWIPINEFQFARYDQEMSANLIRYQLCMAFLVFLQTPIAGVFTTLYVGQAVFEREPTWKSVIDEARKTIVRWFWELGIIRGPIPLMTLLAFSWGEEESSGWFYVWPIFLVIFVSLLRGNRPFMPEILLLERCPIFVSKKLEAISAHKRSVALHRPISGELVGRFIAMSVMLCALAMLGFYSLLWLRGTLFGLWEWDKYVYLLLYPLALWAAGALSTLVRFLSYLDTRIRLEGWEIQLAVRAEAIRQFGEQDTASPGRIVDNAVLDTQGASV